VSTVVPHTALERIRHVGIIPVIRADAESTALRIAEALVGAGLGVIEITMTVPNATSVMESAAKRFGADIIIGAGTITTAAMAGDAVDSGCTFIVTPAVLPQVVTAARARGVPVICGALTPTEILAAHQAGADLVKVFPASAIGGPAYIRAVRGPFPDIGLVATGGVGLPTVGSYFEAGCVAVGVGSELISREAVAAGAFASIGDLGRQFREEARRAMAAGSGPARRKPGLTP
jgi:2-dehydro-3-deoxyphosphogluconate aldolase/(4S)-4-hydroxy-2-oxoglutarate aldolase